MCNRSCRQKSSIQVSFDKNFKVKDMNPEKTKISGVNENLGEISIDEISIDEISENEVLRSSVAKTQQPDPEGLTYAHFMNNKESQNFKYEFIIVVLRLDSSYQKFSKKNFAVKNWGSILMLTKFDKYLHSENPS